MPTKTPPKEEGEEWISSFYSAPKAKIHTLKGKELDEHLKELKEEIQDFGTIHKCSTTGILFICPN